MHFKGRIFGLTIIGLILTFALIHLGVSIGIIVSYRQYGDIFRPQIGLSSYNLVICILAFITGILGLFCILKHDERLGKITAIISGVLGIFTLASLVTAIIINSKSLSYVSTRFSNNMDKYTIDQGARNIINRLQTERQCCGEDMWLDWARVGLNGTLPVTNETTTLTGSSTTITSIGIVTNTTSITGTVSSTTSITPTPLSTITITAIASSTSIITQPNPNFTETQQAVTGGVAINTTGASSKRLRRQSHLLSDTSRQKRQATSIYGGINGLPLSFGVTLPGSCCTSEGTITGDTSDSYCISNANGVANYFYITGCSKSLDVIAGNQAMGIGVINCFMIVLAFTAIPVVLQRLS